MPRRARWQKGWVDEPGNEAPPLKHLKHNIGEMLNKALAVLAADKNLQAAITRMTDEIEEWWQTAQAA